MAENKKSFVLYCDLVHVIRKLVEQDRKNKTNYSGELFLHILEYVNGENPIPINFIVDMAFEPIKQQLKRDLKRYEIKQTQRIEAGRRSAEQRKANEEQRNSTTVDDRSVSCTVNGNVNVNDNVNNIKKEITPQPPKGDKKTVDESSLNYRAKELFISHFLKLFGNPYYWTAKDAGQMNQLLKKLSFQMKEKARGAEISDNDILSALNVFLNGINDKWINENFSVSVICSKFNEIISQIKSNATKKTIGITTEQNERDFIEAVLNGAGRAEYERNQRLQRQPG